MYLRYPTPHAHPRLNGLGFAVEASIIEVELRSVLETLYERRANAVASVETRLDRRCVAELERLAAETEEGDVVEAPPQLHAWLIPEVGVAMLHHQFRSVFCPACRATFSRRQVSVHDGGWDESPAMVGGHQFRSPAEHVLYVMVRFDIRGREGG